MLLPVLLVVAPDKVDAEAEVELLLLLLFANELLFEAVELLVLLVVDADVPDEVSIADDDMATEEVEFDKSEVELLPNMLFEDVDDVIVELVVVGTFGMTGGGPNGNMRLLKPSRVGFMRDN